MSKKNKTNKSSIPPDGPIPEGTVLHRMLQLAAAGVARTLCQGGQQRENAPGRVPSPSSRTTTGTATKAPTRP